MYDERRGTLQAAHFAQELKARDPGTIGQMRKEIFTHAVELAELAFAEHDDEQCIVSVDNGAGFFIREFSTLAQRDKKNQTIQISRSPGKSTTSA